MGRQYTMVDVCNDHHLLEGLTALFDSGADISVISTEMAEELEISMPIIEIEWHSSDGRDECSPIVELEVKTREDDDFLLLPAVMIDDRPIDLEVGEQMVLGLDYLQKAKRILRSDD